MARKSRSIVIQSDDPYAICIVSVAPLRSRPSHSEEQISQVLFGEHVRILDRQGKNWYKVKCEWDAYVAWVDSKQVFRIDQKEFDKNKKHQAFALELVHGAMCSSFGMPICIGSTLPQFDGISCRTPMGKMTYSGQAIFDDTIEIDEYRLVKLGLKYLHAPYQWGGRSPFGIDGSGLIQMIYKLAGLRVPRDANRQLALGEIIDFPSDAKAADLAFFEDTKGNIIHVGMITQPSQILHAHGKVRIDYFDHHGIYNSELGKYTHKLRIIKRIKIRETEEDHKGSSKHTNSSLVDPS